MPTTRAPGAAPPRVIAVCGSASSAASVAAASAAPPGPSAPSASSTASASARAAVIGASAQREPGAARARSSVAATSFGVSSAPSWNRMPLRIAIRATRFAGSTAGASAATCGCTSPDGPTR